VAASLGAQLKYAFDAQKHAEFVIEPTRTVELAMDYLRNDIQNAVVPNSTSTTAEAGYESSPIYLAGTFEGAQSTDARGREADAVTFFTTADAPEHIDANGEIKQVTLQVVQDTSSGDYVLVRRVIRNLIPPDSLENPDEEVLCRGVASFTLQYFDGSNWDTAWDSTQEDNTLPAAVQITLELERPYNVNSTQTHMITYTRIFQIPSSTAALDTTVNTGNGL
jgi:hypothetical protein